MDIAVKTRSSSFKYLCLNVACQGDDCVLLFRFELFIDYLEETRIFLSLAWVTKCVTVKWCCHSVRERLQACLVLNWEHYAVSCFARLVKPHDLCICDLIYLSSIKINIKNVMNLLLDSSAVVSGSKTPARGHFIILCDVTF